jgi:NAD(P)-dependent dehydrogenase (short-subunit alcohol dehydrogenase family)
VSEPITIERFEGRAAFVTGGAQGIGLGIARALAAAGAKVAIADVNRDALAAAEKELSGRTDAMAIALDVRDRDAYARAADAVEHRLGPVTLLFNNAGVAGGVAAAQMSYPSWDWVIGINVQGVYNGVQTFVPRMMARGRGGYVVNTASGAGLVATSSGFLYTTSKFAVVGLSEALHLELARHGIGVSVLCPGPVATKIVRNTAALNPERTGVATNSSADVASRLAATEAFLAAGAAPDAVGEMVLSAMRAGRLHIYTDDMMEPLIKQRTEQLLAALPSVLQS